MASKDLEGYGRVLFTQLRWERKEAVIIINQCSQEKEVYVKRGGGDKWGNVRTILPIAL
jgi:hypothetical protein